jgi:hypothetical protein
VTLTPSLSRRGPSPFPARWLKRGAPPVGDSEVATWIVHNQQEDRRWGMSSRIAHIKTPMLGVADQRCSRCGGALMNWEDDGDCLCARTLERSAPPMSGKAAKRALQDIKTPLSSLAQDSLDAIAEPSRIDTLTRRIVLLKQQLAEAQRELADLQAAQQLDTRRAMGLASSAPP